MADLSEHRRKLFQKDHRAGCPGLVSVNFYGDGKPTYALVLIGGNNPKRRAELIVAHQVAGDWEIRSLDVTDGTPVVWREGPGKYDGMSESNTIRAKNPVVVFLQLGVMGARVRLERQRSREAPNLRLDGRTCSRLTAKAQ